jgi:hypothetical protein
MSAAESTDNGVTSEPVKQIEIMDPTKKDKIQCFDPPNRDSVMSWP